MTIELLIHAIVRQTTVLIAQLATSQGLRAPLAQIANQVFLDLAREVERQGVSRSVSANMFGLGLRTYRRKVQRLSESSTDQGRSLWEAVLEYIVTNGLVNRAQVLARFSGDDEVQVKSVLIDLCESQLVFSSGAGQSMAYRAATPEESAVLQHARGSQGDEDLLVSLMFREGPMSVEQIANLSQLDAKKVADALERMLATGSVEQVTTEDEVHYRACSLVIPLGSPAGWEGAVFDHFKAVVATVLCRLRENRPSQEEDLIGGSTYTVNVWDGHPLADEVLGTLRRMRTMLSDVRRRVDEHNETCDLPNEHSRVVLYVGQCVFPEEYEQSE